MSALLESELRTYTQRIKAAGDCADAGCRYAAIDYAKLAAISAWHGVAAAREAGDLDEVVAWQWREERADALVAALEQRLAA